MEQSSPSNTLSTEQSQCSGYAFGILPFHLVQRTLSPNMLLFITCALGVMFKDGFSLGTLLSTESVPIYRW